MELQKEIVRRSAHFMDITGQRFGKLTVIEESAALVHPVTGRIQNARWLVLCDCGEQRFKTTSELRAGRSKSCGCWARELRSKRLSFPEGAAARNRLLKEYQSAAEKRGLIWDLSEEDFDYLIKSDCHYCGIKPNAEFTVMRSGKRVPSGLIYNGIDRVENNTGYKKDNVVPCCKLCNRAKSVLSYDDFVSMCSRVAERHGPKDLKSICA